jgi:hypothetical protein
MTQVRRRYTTVRDGKDFLVTISWEESAFQSAHWFEAQVAVQQEPDGTPLKLPRELATYRVGETERPYRELVRLDFGGDREAALGHLLGTICRRVYAFIERGH